MEQKFKIDKSIYKVKNIKEAVNDFNEVALIKYNSKKEELIIFWDNKEEIEEVFNEFMNYIISLECN